MGASGWSYFVPYQEDIEKALENLRSHVLNKGEFYLRASRAEMIADLEAELAKPQEEQFGFPDHQEAEWRDSLREEAIETLNALKALSEPITEEDELNEIYLINQESGTHSILDIFKVTAEPEFGSVSPLNTEQLIELFGTGKPAKEHVEKANLTWQLPNLRGSWEGAYVILYKNDEPSEIWFFGFSGD